MPRVPAKVLIAEDEPELRGLIRMALEVEPFELFEAADAGAALEVARRERPDLILLDRRMPGGDGLEVCRALRADPRTAPSKIVLLTVRAQNVDRLEGFRAGAERLRRQAVHIPRRSSPRRCTSGAGGALA
jgi:two-component system phosphate regulon response regulator PhoB